jgi:hypothetical protein
MFSSSSFDFPSSLWHSVVVPESDSVIEQVVAVGPLPDTQLGTHALTVAENWETGSWDRM